MKPTDVMLNDGSGTNARMGQLEKTFHCATGKRTLLLLNSFPFLIIGIVRGTAGGLVSVEAETAHLSELEGRPLWIQLDAVEVFYIEDGQHAIPRIRPAPSAT